MDLQLNGTTAVVTGGSKGIGLATVRELIGEGAKVVTGSRSITAGLAESGAVAVAVDLTSPEGADELITRAKAELGGIDILVNNVGMGDFDDAVMGGVADIPDSAWRHVFNLHFYSALWSTRAALPSLVERKGVIVNVSSNVARMPQGRLDYGVSKMALSAFSKGISEELAPRGVRVNTVSPGPVSTGVWTDPEGFIGQAAKAFGTDHATLVEQMMQQMNPATQRMSTPEEVARLITFLASPSNIVGADIVIDGGMIKTV